MFGIAVCVHYFLKGMLEQLLENEPIARPDEDGQEVAIADLNGGDVVWQAAAGDDHAAGALVERDEMEMKSKERAYSWQKAKTWMQTDWFADFWIMRASSQPQVALMSTTLAEASFKHEATQMSSLIVAETRRSHITDLLARRSIKVMFVEGRFNRSIWNVLPPTSRQRSAIFRHCVRAAGVIFHHVCERFPWVLTDASEQKAAALLSLSKAIAQKPRKK